jgi:hypothetical protein
MVRNAARCSGVEIGSLAGKVDSVKVYQQIYEFSEVVMESLQFCGLLLGVATYSKENCRRDV